MIFYDIEKKNILLNLMKIVIMYGYEYSTFNPYWFHPKGILSFEFKTNQYAFNQLFIETVLKEDKISEYEKKEKTITIGKSDNCTLCLEKKNNISEIQCNLTYNTKDNLWVLSDGFENKMSDNGTWILASSTYPLYNNLEIDIFSNYLKINIY